MSRPSHVTLESIDGNRDGRADAFFNVLNPKYGAKGNGETDDTAAFNAALSDANGRPVIVPDTGSSYKCSKLTLSNNATIIGVGNRPTIFTPDTGGDAHNISLFGASGVYLENLTLDGNGTNGNNIILATSNDIVLKNLTLKDARSGIGSGAGNASYNVRIEDLLVSGASSHGISFDRTYESTVRRVQIDQCGGFGFRVTGGARDNRFEDCWTINNDLEFFNTDYDALRITVINCYSTGTGDNGFSMRGRGHMLVGCNATANDHNGFAIVGEEIKCIGCHAENNGQGTGTRAGFRISAQFGGLAYRNHIIGCTGIDTQGTATQDYGVLIGDNNTVEWQSSQTVTGSNPWRFNGNNLYLAETIASTGVSDDTGSTPPTHTSGTVSDGEIDWTYISTSPTTGTNRFNAQDCHVIAGTYAGNATADVQYDSALDNQVLVDGYQRFLNMPTSSASLDTGQVYSNSNVLTLA